MRASLVLTVMVSSALGMSLAPRPARACSRLATSNIQGFSTLPRDGQGAPRNTKVWHAASRGEVTSAVLVDAAGREVPSTLTRLPVSSEAREELLVLTPDALLSPGEVELRVNGQRVVRFVVLDQQDLEAPPALAPIVAEVTGAFSGGYSCGAPATVRLALGVEAELAIAAPGAVSWPPPEVRGAGVGSALTVALLPEGPQRLTLFHLDLAGNLAATSEVEFTVPAKQRGCASVDGWALGLPGLLLLLRRRRVA
jgi:hypothetical protein